MRRPLLPALPRLTGRETERIRLFDHLKSHPEENGESPRELNHDPNFFTRLAQASSRRSSQDFKPGRAEVLVKRERVLDIQAAHHRKTRAIDHVGARSRVMVV